MNQAAGKGGGGVALTRLTLLVLGSALTGWLLAAGSDLPTRLTFMALATLLAWAVIRETRGLTTFHAALEERLRHEEAIADSQAWLAAMKESALNMAEALNHASRLVHFSRNMNILDHDALRDVARRFLPKLFQVDRFSVFLYRVHRRQLVLFAHNHPEWDDMEASFTLPLAGGTRIMADAVSSRAPVVVKSFAHSRYANPKSRQWYSEGPAMCIPLEADGQVIGVINLNGLQVDDINPGYLAMVKQAAAHFALALYNTQLVSRINDQAVRDPLTGLFNRRQFYQCAARLADRTARANGRFSLLLLDVDGFKGINDTHGHATGDRMLKTVAEELKQAIRRTDTACRIGGDEFVALLEEATGEEAARMAARLCASLAARRPLVNGGTPVELAVSVGIAECRRGEGYDRLLQRADEALYAAKRGGRNTWVLAGAPAPALPLPATASLPVRRG